VFYLYITVHQGCTHHPGQTVISALPGLRAPFLSVACHNNLTIIESSDVYLGDFFCSGNLPAKLNSGVDRGLSIAHEIGSVEPPSRPVS